MPSFFAGRLRAAQVLLLSASAFAATVATAGTADASIVVPKVGEAPHVSLVKIAMSTTAQRSVVWEQLAIDSGSGDLAWIVAVPKGGFVEGADPTWFEALDSVSAPIIAPSKSLGCGVVADETTADPKATTAPRAVDRALFPQTTGAITAERLKAAGYAIDASIEKMLAQVDADGEEVVTLHLPPGVGPTRVIRVLGPPARPLPLDLAPIGPKIRLVTWMLASSRVKIADAPANDVAFERLVWLGTQSNYKSILDDAISTVAPSAGVAVPFASADAVFADQPTGTLGHTVPSLVRAYFGADDDAGTGPWACAKHASAYATSYQYVAPSCAKAPPWTSDAPVPPCVDPPKDTVSPAELVCGARDDLGVALGGALPSHFEITRFESWSYPHVTRARIEEETHLGSLPVFHQAKTLATGACPPVVDPPPGTGGDPTGTTDPGSGYDPGGGSQPSPPTTQVIVHDGCSSSGAGTGCGKSSSSTSNDGCSKKEGSSSDEGCGKSSSSGDDGCGKSSKSSDDGCGKSSGSGGDGCGKGSSSSSSDNGCGGGGSSGSGGGCGSSSSGADKGCAVSPSVPRLKFSILGYLAVAVATVLRRATRRRKRGS